jgi:hypothetical protein
MTSGAQELRMKTNERGFARQDMTRMNTIEIDATAGRLTQIEYDLCLCVLHLIMSGARNTKRCIAWTSCFVVLPSPSSDLNTAKTYMCVRANVGGLPTTHAAYNNQRSAIDVLAQTAIFLQLADSLVHDLRKVSKLGPWILAIILRNVSSLMLEYAQQYISLPQVRSRITNDSHIGLPAVLEMLELQSVVQVVMKEVQRAVTLHESLAGT